MQPSIIVGFLVGFGSLCLSVLIDAHWNFHAITAFFNFSAMLIIFGGISGAIIIGFPVSHLRQIPVALKKAFLQYQDIDRIQMSLKLTSLSQHARQNGVLSLEGLLPEIEDDWMRRGLQMVVDGMDRNVIKDVMEVELEEFTRKTRIGGSIFMALGGFAPTLGIIGTVMGLVHMLATLDDPSKIGTAIAVAFLATFWGILMANLVFLPIGERVKIMDEELIITRQAMIEGILSINAGESVRILEEKLKVFMTAEEREEFSQARISETEV